MASAGHHPGAAHGHAHILFGTRLGAVTAAVVAESHALSAHVVVEDRADTEEVLGRLKELLLEGFDLAPTTLQLERHGFVEVRGDV